MTKRWRGYAIQGHMDGAEMLYKEEEPAEDVAV